MARKEQIGIVVGFVALMVLLAPGRTIPVAGQDVMPELDVAPGAAAPLGPYTLFLPHMQGSSSGEVQAEVTTVLHEDFEDDAVGALVAPWSISKAGASQVSIVNTTDHGHVLRLLGSSTEGDFLIASRSFSSSGTEIRVRVAIKPASGATFIWSLHGAGSSIGRRRIRLQREPGSNTLNSNTVPGGTRPCATLASGVWSTVTLRVHATGLEHTFDVLINGQPTACTGLSTGLSPPFTGVSVMDASNLSWGGDVRFDNIDVFRP